MKMLFPNPTLILASMQVTACGAGFPLVEVSFGNGVFCSLDAGDFFESLGWSRRLRFVNALVIRTGDNGFASPVAAFALLGFI